MPNVVQLPRRLASPAVLSAAADAPSLLGDDLRRLVAENYKLLMAQHVRRFDDIAVRYFELVSSLAQTCARDEVLANIVIARRIIRTTLLRLRAGADERGSSLP